MTFKKYIAKVFHLPKKEEKSAVKFCIFASTLKGKDLKKWCRRCKHQNHVSCPIYKASVVDLFKRA